MLCVIAPTQRAASGISFPNSALAAIDRADCAGPINHEIDPVSLIIHRHRITRTDDPHFPQQQDMFKHGGGLPDAVSICGCVAGILIRCRQRRGRGGATGKGYQGDQAFHDNDCCRICTKHKSEVESGAAFADCLFDLNRSYLTCVHVQQSRLRPVNRFK